MWSNISYVHLIAALKKVYTERFILMIYQLKTSLFIIMKEKSVKEVLKKGWSTWYIQ